MHITVADTRSNVQVTGPDDAPVVLLIHSLATDLTVWEDLVGASSDWRFVRYDLRGHGGSEATPPPYDLDRLIDDAVGVLDAVGAQRARVVGLSIGAMIGMGLAIDHPSRVDRLVVADARADAPAEYIAMWDAAIDDAEAGRFDEVVATSVERWFTAATHRDRPGLIAHTAALAAGTSIAGFVGCARALQGLAYLDRLHQISVPTLFVAGESDPAASPATMAAMADRVAGARFELIADAAHLTPLEAPDDFNQLVLDFLDARARINAPVEQPLEQ